MQNRKPDYPFRSSRRMGANLYGVAILIVLLFLLFAVFLPQFFKMKEGIYRVSCKEIRRKIEVGVSNYDSNNSKSMVKAGAPIDLDVLKANGFLAEIQRCPLGGKFIFGPQGEIWCTAHPIVKDGPVSTKRPGGAGSTDPGIAASETALVTSPSGVRQISATSTSENKQ